MKRILLLALTLLLTLHVSLALALAVPNTKTIEETTVYEDETIRVQIDRWCYAFNKTDLRFFVANVWVEDPAQLATAFAGEEYSKSNAEATSEIAERHDAVLAVNGDYYNYKDNISLIIRNGELYREKATDRHQLLVYEDGHFEAVRPENYAAGNGQAYLDAGVKQSFTFGPILVENGEIVELPKKYVINTKDTIREPRTAIGIVDEHHYVVIVADGRRDGWSDKGMALQELQEVFVEQGCVTAYNLDGGGSATMVLNGQLVNKTSGSRQRNVSDILYFSR